MKLEDSFYKAVAVWLRQQPNSVKPVDEVLSVYDDSGMQYETFGGGWEHDVNILYTSKGKPHYFSWYDTLYAMLEELLQIDV